jgi:hypothetical protein
MNLGVIDKANAIYERFINLLTVDRNGCWLYRTPAKSGYANFGINKKLAVRAHRFSYQAHKGDIPAGMQIDHLCSVKNCCNPDHLEAVTPKENTRRAWERGEAKKHPPEIALRAGRIGNAAAVRKKLAQTRCKRGHEYSEENTIKLPKGGRDCRRCQKLRARRAYERRKCLL